MLQLSVIGNLGRDAEVKHIGERDYIAFSVASTEKENGEEVTRWISVLASNNQNIIPYLRKGQQVFLSGRYQDKMYTHQYGVGIDRQLFANVLQLCGGKRDDSSPVQASVPMHNPASASPSGDPLPEPQGEEGDLPF